MARLGTGTTALWFEQLDAWEAGLCLRCNRLAQRATVRRYFSIASRLGDGIAWYATLALLPVVVGLSALGPSLHMGLTALAGVAIYKCIKNLLNRERPFASHRAVEALVRPLDRYSFPSGHTLHAVTFTIMLGYYYPPLLVVAVPFALSVAASRVVLGLHYPTDVAAGAAVGTLLAVVSLYLGAPL